MIAPDRRVGRPVAQRSGFDRGQPWRWAARGRRTARQALDPFGCKDRPDRLRGHRRARDCQLGGDLLDRAVQSTQLEHAVTHTVGLARRARSWLGGTEVLRVAGPQLAGHLMHAGRRVPKPLSDLAGLKPVDEVRAHRFVAPLRRFGRLKEIRRPDPHTSTDLPEQHPHRVERLSDSFVRPTPLTGRRRSESVRFLAPRRPRRQQVAITDSPRTRP